MVDVSELLSLVGNIARIFFVVIIAILYPKFDDFLKSHFTKETQDTIRMLIDSYVKAADQLYHDSDPSGKIRKDYVLSRIQEFGIEPDTEILGIIEGSVWDINNKNKNKEIGIKDGNSK